MNILSVNLLTLSFNLFLCLIEALKIAIESRIKKRMMYAKGDSPLLQSISLAPSRLPPRLGDPLFDESQLRSPKPNLAAEIKLNDSQNLSQVMKEDNTFTLDKTQLSNSQLLLDNIGPQKPHVRGHHSTRGYKESQFFVTNEFLNLNYLNNNRTPHPQLNDKSKKSFLNKLYLTIR